MRQFFLLLFILALMLLAAARTTRSFHVAEAWWVFASVASMIAVKICFYVERAESGIKSLGIRYGLFSGVSLLLIFIYFLNPSHQWVPGSGLIPRDFISGLPASAFAPGTRDSLVFAFGGFSVLGLAMVLSRRSTSALGFLIIMAGALMAGMVIQQRLEPKPFPVFPVTGIFVSENHYAQFANFTLAIVVMKCWRSSSLSVATPVLLATAGIIIYSVYLCGSRAGLAIASMILFCGILIPPAAWGIKHRSFRLLAFMQKKAVAILILAMVFAGSLMIGFGWRYVSQFGNELTYRGRVLADSLGIVRDNPWWGSGPGTYAYVFPYYQSEAIKGRFFDHAHSEPIQFLAEYGVLGSLIVSGLAIGLVFGGNAARPGAIYDPPILAWLVALGGCFTHGLIDFPFRQPLIALMCFVAAGFIIRARHGLEH